MPVRCWLPAVPPRPAVRQEQQAVAAAAAAAAGRPQQAARMVHAHAPWPACCWCACAAGARRPCGRYARSGSCPRAQSRGRRLAPAESGMHSTSSHKQFQACNPTHRLSCRRTDQRYCRSQACVLSMMILQSGAAGVSAPRRCCFSWRWWCPSGSPSSPCHWPSG